MDNFNIISDDDNKKALEIDPLTSSDAFPESFKPHVLLVSNDVHYMRGAFRSMVILADELKKLGAEVNIIIPSHNAGAEEMLKSLDIPYSVIWSRTWARKSDIAYSDRVKRFIKRIGNVVCIPIYWKYISKNDIDIVHINNVHHYAIARALRLIPKNRRPYLVWHIREFLEEDQGNQFTSPRLAKKLLNSADQVISVSESVKDKYDKMINKPKHSVVYNGIRTISKYPNNRVLFQSDHIEFAVIGTLQEKKGQEIAIKALRLLSIKKPIVLHLFGSGSRSYEDSLHKLAEDMPAGISVVFEGSIPDVQEQLNDIDALLMSSECEAFGRVTVEAMMAGCLVIGSNSGGTSEIIKDGVTGLLFHPGDASDLAHAITWAIDHPTAANTIAQAGQQYAYEKFTAEQNAAEIFQLYINMAIRSIE